MIQQDKDVIKLRQMLVESSFMVMRALNFWMRDAIIWLFSTRFTFEVNFLILAFQWNAWTNRQVPISNISTFFPEEGLTTDYCTWEDTLSKSRNTHFPNLSNKPWRWYDFIILKKMFFSLEKLNKCFNRNKF